MPNLSFVKMYVFQLDAPMHVLVVIKQNVECQKLTPAQQNVLVLNGFYNRYKNEPLSF